MQETKEYIKQLAKGEDGKRQNRLDVLKATIYKKELVKELLDVLNKYEIFGKYPKKTCPSDTDCVL